MARIFTDKLVKMDKKINKVHEEVYGTFTVFVKDGEKYFQLDTYGKPDREMPEKISQSIQFDEVAAKQLIELINKELKI